MSSLSRILQESSYKLITESLHLTITAGDVESQRALFCMSFGTVSGFNPFGEPEDCLWTDPETHCTILREKLSSLPPSAQFSVSKRKYHLFLVIPLINAARACIPTKWKDTTSPCLLGNNMKGFKRHSFTGSGINYQLNIRWFVRSIPKLWT